MESSAAAHPCNAEVCEVVLLASPGCSSGSVWQTDHACPRNTYLVKFEALTRQYPEDLADPTLLSAPTNLGTQKKLQEQLAVVGPVAAAAVQEGSAQQMAEVFAVVDLLLRVPWAAVTV